MIPCFKFYKIHKTIFIFLFILRKLDVKGKKKYTAECRDATTWSTHSSMLAFFRCESHDCTVCINDHIAKDTWNFLDIATCNNKDDQLIPDKVAGERGVTTKYVPNMGLLERNTTERTWCCSWWFLEERLAEALSI